MRQGEFNSASLTAAYLEAIALYEPALGSFLHVGRSEALATARALDALRAAGTDLGPLMGVPIALKDHISVTGMPTRAGSDLDISALVAREGSLVRRLRESGCVILGKTRATEFALGSFNLRHPTPRNPWDAQVARMPGGSSNGSAVAVAARLCAFAFGSDTGGSVRQPAALCGIVGYKPSNDVFPIDGVFPLSPALDTLGTLTRSVADAILVYETFAKTTVRRRSSARGLRLGRPAGRFFDALDAGVSRAIDRALATLAVAGVELVEIAPAIDFDAIDEVFATIVPADLIATLGADRFIAQAHLIDPIARERAHAGLEAKASDYVRLQRACRKFVQQARASFSGIDAWITPTTPTTAIPIAACRTPADGAAWNRRSLRNTRPLNVLAQCAISLPIPTSDSGLPIGLQLSAPLGEDGPLLSLALAVEEALGTGAAPDLGAFPAAHRS